MSSFLVGHREKKQSKAKFISVVIAILIIMGLGLLAYVLTPDELPRQDKPVKISLPGQIKVIKSLTCLQINNGLPQGVSDVFYTKENVYFYNELLMAQVPKTIKHVWTNPQGQLHASVELEIVNQEAHTWSYITLPPGGQGEWQVETVVEDKVLAEVNFRAERNTSREVY